MGHRLVIATLALLAASCSGRDAAAPTAVRGGAPHWRAVATEADRDRLRGWREAWTRGLAQARAGGAAGAVAAQGSLFDPDRALADPVPPPGDYRCRVFKLGAGRASQRTFTAYPFFTCRIAREGHVTSFRKLDGTQRHVGLIFDDPGGRPVFLGTLMLGDEPRALGYGRDRTRDMAGFVDRVADRRWRLALPYPAFDSLIDVVELVPAAL